jgi:hypothetical protein
MAIPQFQPINIVGNFLAGQQERQQQQATGQENALRQFQLIRAQNVNALSQDPNATPQQYIRAGDVQTGNALMANQEMVDSKKKDALTEIGGLAQKALTITDPQQRKAFLQQATPAYADAFQTLGADHTQGLDLSNLPDSQLEQRLQSVARFAPPQKPIEVQPGGSLVTQKADGSFSSGYTAPPAPITPYQQGELKNKQAAEAETARHNRATEGANNPFLAGSQPNDPNMPTGDAYLQKLPANLATQVKALADGRLQFPSGMALKTPYWQQMLGAVAQYDPTFDAINYNSRSATRRDFTAGKSAQNIKSLNTAIGHLGTLDSQIDGTASHSFTPANAVQNYAASTFGSSGPTQFTQTAGALASELTAVFRGSGGAEADVKRYLSELSPNASYEQKKAAVRNITELLASRTAAIGDQYNKGMGKSEDPLTLLDPKAAAVLQRIGGNSGAAPDTSVPTATGPNGRKLYLRNGQWSPQ